MEIERRNFIKRVAVGATGVAAGFPMISKGDIIGANDRVRLAVMGVNSRGNSLTRSLVGLENAEVAYICDVDSSALAKGLKTVKDKTGKSAKGVDDFRLALDDNSIDALVIAAPDHWHGPASIMACSAGKHVYVEKPCSHNPSEGEMMILAAKKHKRLVQMGTQRRSWPVMKKAMSELHNGRIGSVYFAKAWYANNRGPIGVGKQVPVPQNLNYELWQGPAPRRPYVDNLIHYNWHWHWHWGTGEALNNGTHELDLVRWGLDVDYASKVSSLGGRYHYKDDWETPDTQIINFDFGDNKSAVWEGRSCNSRPVEGSGRGVVFYGTEGSMFTDGGNKFQIFDKQNQLLEEIKEGEDVDVMNTTSPSGNLDVPHLNNFLEAIRKDRNLNASIETGFKSVLLCQQGNISYRTGRTLNIDQSSGKILNDPDAMKLWSREYEKGWDVTV